MTSREFHFISADGLEVFCTRWSNRRPGRGIFQIAHGLGEPMGRYQSLIETMVRAGLIVYANDPRGHGRTARSRREFGDFGPGGFELLVNDMAHLSEIAQSENPGQPLILFGHNLGSLAGQYYILDHSQRIDGLVLSGAGALDELAPVAKSALAGSHFLNTAFEPARTAFDGLADHWRLKCVRRDLPIYLLAGSDDSVGQRLKGAKVLVDRYRKAGLHNITCHFYPGGWHQIFDEVNNNEVRTNLLLWISSVLGW
jgi:alpha-beta hydrolase superfamily lysophospholipase